MVLYNWFCGGIYFSSHQREDWKTNFVAQAEVLRSILDVAIEDHALYLKLRSLESVRQVSGSRSPTV